MVNCSSEKSVRKKRKEKTRTLLEIVDWAPGMSVPADIQLMYFIQCGFYLHSIYGTLYMDNKRKDFYAMLIHHVITMTLIFVSYATRFESDWERQQSDQRRVLLLVIIKLVCSFFSFTISPIFGWN